MNVCFIAAGWDYPRVAVLAPQAHVPRVGETVAIRPPGAKYAKTYRVTAVYWWLEGADDHDVLTPLPGETCTVQMEQLPGTFHIDYATVTPEPDHAAESALAHLLPAGMLRALRGDSPIIENVAVELEKAGLCTLGGKTAAGEHDWVLSNLGQRVLKRAVEQGR